jgi:threonyl-tRNA synthetase
LCVFCFIFIPKGAFMKATDREHELYAMRHSMAHIMATAIQELYPEAKFGIGPVIENGFYYDVALSKALSTEDLGAIEAKMQEVIKADYPFEHSQMDLDEAIGYFTDKDQTYKLDLLNDLKSHGTTVAKDIDRVQLGIDEGSKVDEVSIYTDGPFTDLCRGPHVESTGKVGVFKLMRVSGAYWRGDEKNAQLQRVYGVGFATKDELKEHLHNLEEAEKRDHRKLGRELDLFTFSDLVGPGLPLYTPRGTVLIEEIKGALKEISKRHGMLQVSIPHLAKRELYETSGHAQKFSDELFTVKSHYDQEFILKPVNCPHHTQIYAGKPRSYRELPLRYIEQTMQYRDEKPGQIGGLQRTRGFTVDDGHTFCRVDQITEEASVIVEIIKEFYEGLGLWGEHWVSLSVRDPKTPDAYIGEPSDWDKAEAMLDEVSTTFKLDAQRMEGEAAIYGPKLDFMFKDALGRETQLATVQLDFAMPKRFKLEYIDAEGQPQTPVMIHRAILGSFERFIMIMIEHYAGAFPTWLAPEQVRIFTVNDTDPLVNYALELKKEFETVGLRVGFDRSAEGVGKKIRAAGLAKVPYTLVIGEKEVESGMVNPRLRTGHGDEPGEMSVEAFAEGITKEVAERSPKSVFNEVL